MSKRDELTDLFLHHFPCAEIDWINQANSTVLKVWLIDNPNYVMWIYFTNYFTSQEIEQYGFYGCFYANEDPNVTELSFYRQWDNIHRNSINDNAFVVFNCIYGTALEQVPELLKKENQ